ncbi:TPA: hypothetical protein IUW97_002487 [Enterococcus faecalis]|uniref:hypothetical protein n=1 Tax=Enterococcus faecalis TaxID=1351 RepID=UPI000E098A87|nr:hypothetical protein [Enterococcus faecalis]AXG89532.1 hypothetical protein DTO64_13565 [Enterococcus faecalis]EGO6085131.1 hypothetical protein [Enterococcus faecalis]EIT2194752.1 hypothetical protein [Enterococcus faecalis]EJB2749863.1 hypothetical protein [Enterococcus faecalis]ELY8687303.1 hypothetical protein [Enterococcus faecalis]
MKFELNGFDELQHELNQFAKNADSLDGEHSVPFDELFTKEFMIENTKFSNIDEFIEKSGFDFSDMESIDDNKLDKFISSNTNFDSWEDMKSAAGSEWAAKKLGF